MTDQSISDSVRHFIQGRPFCFVIMSHRPEYDGWYERISNFMELSAGVVCRRADRHQASGLDLRAKVHEMIKQADVVLAEISVDSPNVYYEYGYAMAHNRPPILTVRKGWSPPADLRGLEVLEYEGDPGKDFGYLELLKQNIRARLRTPVPELRKMMEPSTPFPSYILAAPRVPGLASRHWWHPDETATFGDNQGIRGFFAAYGSIFGTAQLPELLHANSVPENLHDLQANFFLIGSPKVNPVAGSFLRVLHVLYQPAWELVRSGPEEDSAMVFRGPSEWEHVFSKPIGRNPDGSVEDLGLLIRVPHPKAPQFMIMVMMGRHSIGTGAACLAATNPILIRSIESELNGQRVPMEIKTMPIWALVGGRMTSDGAMPPENVRVIACGMFQFHPVPTGRQ